MKISEFKTDVYYQNPSYLGCSYGAGYLLDETMEKEKKHEQYIRIRKKNN